MTTIKVAPLAEDLAFGARVTGVTRDALDDENVRAQLREALDQRGVLVCREVEQTSDMQVKLSTVFGPLKEHPVYAVDRADRDKLPGVIVIATGPGSCIVEIDGKPLVTWQPWHFDHAYNNEMMYAAVLRSIKTPKDGGRTAFTDGIQILNDMDPALRAKAEQLNVLYNLDLRYDRQRFGLPENFRLVKEHDHTLSQENENGRCAVHPAVWTRPDGEKVFHMCPYGCRGLEGDRSDAAFEQLAEIWNEAQRVMKVYYHEWQPGDMVVWDNTRVLHEATGSNPEEPREIHRTTIKGDLCHGWWEDEARAETVA
ncbi:TauD/TfdA family dioxygenase [Mangrovimicrobium sediminis]|uniref:TauD/TfdA family dioxygenase n=1 Tax=Mangrovimicrobium sediminis TaxID=2562682 RepID=A0A4Z0LZ93_9GAMM|nr:TauD/TfdA family dioxygenase [Haliea sp. SAOS-164]TGD72544.1 TauD/TfdA family dioxygenase [Haliea sp. SAOS-164]